MNKLLLPLLAAALLPVYASAAEPFKIPVTKNHVSGMFGAAQQNSWTGGTSSGFADFFDGNYENGLYMPIWTSSGQRSQNGQYMIIDLTSLNSDGYYLTEVKIWEVGEYACSVYYSTDGNTWSSISGASQVARIGETDAIVNDYAKQVKVVFDVVSDWNPGVSEIELWGIYPQDVECTHPAKYLTEWELVPGTANCTDFGIDQCQCTNCLTWFHRESSTAVPLGHDYEAVLIERGTSLSYGSGTNVCKRCGDEILFPEPKDLTTLGGVAAYGIIQFTDLSVSSTGDTSSGVRPGYLIDDGWTMSWGTYWYAGSNDDTEYVQFAFATAIDLTAIEISVPNRTHTLCFYSVENGTENLISEYAVTADGSNSEYQRKTIEFRGVSLSTLRIKKANTTNKLTICECHPYGTVAGAGKSAAVRTRIIID